MAAGAASRVAEARNRLKKDLLVDGSPEFSIKELGEFDCRGVVRTPCLGKVFVCGQQIPEVALMAGQLLQGLPCLVAVVDGTQLGGLLFESGHEALERCMLLLEGLVGFFESSGRQQALTVLLAQLPADAFQARPLCGAAREGPEVRG
jgi:hypothetical protein